MIEKLQIRGFGANEKLAVEFSPNVTSIVGKSFIGKSWMLHALKWVCRNKPSGDSYINWDSDEAKVRLSIDGKKVIRIRNKSVNSYRLSDKAKPYTAFGNDVPRDISEIINLSELNFQGQHTAPFWFCETAGEVSRQLNSIVNLEVIDSTLANIASELRKTRVVIELSEKSLSEVTQEKKDLAYVEDLDTELRQVEKLQELYQANVEKRSTIDQKLELIAKYSSIRENRLGLALDGQKVLSIGDGYAEIAASVQKLSNLVESAQNLRKILENKPPSIEPLEKLNKESEQMATQYNRLDGLIESVENRRREKCQIERELENLKAELKKVAGDRCPLCGNLVKLKS